MPFSIESGPKGQDKSTVHYEKIEANVKIDDTRFAKPVIVVKPAQPEEN
jgi:hypothetical protein